MNDDATKFEIYRVSSTGRLTRILDAQKRLGAVRVCKAICVQSRLPTESCAKDQQEVARSAAVLSSER